MTDPKRVLLLLAAIACSVAACATTSTTIEESWRASATESPRNIAIVYMSQDGAIRRTAEDKMVAQLAARGVHAVPSYHVLADDQMSSEQRAEAKRKLAEAGFDGVITMRLVLRDQSQHGSTFDDFWGSPWSTGYASYGYNELVVRIETNLYSLADNRLLWSALSQTVDPSGAPMVIDETTAVVVNQMQREGVIGHAATATAKR